MAGTQYLQFRRKAAAAGPAAPPAAGAAEPAGVPRRVDWTLIVPAVVTLIVMLWGITAPSYWRDESATLSAVTRSIPQLLRLLGHVDAVHGLYYLLLWPVVHVAGTRELATRIPSAIAMSAAALGVAAIGRRVRSRRAGLYAGLVFAALPLVSVRGHDARPYALETAAAVLASYLMLRAAEEPGRGRLAAYGLSLVLLGYTQMFGLLILTAHAIAWLPAARLAQARQGQAGGSDPPGTAGLARRWLLTVAGVAVALGPLFWLGWRQRGQIAWLPRPDGHAVYLMITYLASTSLASVIVVAALILIGAVRAGWPGRSPLPAPRTGPLTVASAQAMAAPPAAAVTPPTVVSPRAANGTMAASNGPAANNGGIGPRSMGTFCRWNDKKSPSILERDCPARLLTCLALPWLVLPPAILVIASQFTPVYQFMYVEFCLPAVALLAGAGIAALGRPPRQAARGRPLLRAVLRWPPRQAARRWPLRQAGRGWPLRQAALRWPLRRAGRGWPLRWAALGLVVALGMPAQLAIRAPSEGGSLRGAAQILARYERQGDAVFYPGNSVPTWDIAYPVGFGGLRDIGLGETAVAASSLAGVPASRGVIQQRLRGVRRLWVIEMGNSWKPAGITLPPALRLAATYEAGSIRMRLYVRAAGQPPSPRS